MLPFGLRRVVNARLDVFLASFQGSSYAALKFPQSITFNNYISILGMSSPAQIL